MDESFFYHQDYDYYAQQGWMLPTNPSMCLSKSKHVYYWSPLDGTRLREWWLVR